MKRANRFDRQNADYQVRQAAVAASSELTFHDVERICKAFGKKFSREAVHDLYVSALAAYRETRHANEIPDGHTIEGETFQQWAKRQFEFENCDECGQDETGHDAAIVMGNWFARCKPQPVTDVIFRVWRIKGGGVIALFPADPQDTAGKYCASFEHVGQHSGADYAMVMQRTRAARPEEYADLQKELESQPYRYRLRVCKRQTPQHRREFNVTYKSWLTRNQDSGVKSTLAPGSDTQPERKPKAGDLFIYEGARVWIEEITSLFHIPSIRFVAKGQNQYVTIEALEWDEGDAKVNVWRKRPLTDDAD